MSADPIDLCTLADVRLALQKQAAATQQDTLIQDCVTSASDAIMELTGREFVSLRSAGDAVDFRYEGGGILALDWRCDLREVESITVSDGGASPDPQVLTEDDYRFPTLNPRGGVQTHIELRNVGPAASVSSVDYAPSRVVTITGTWGFEEVPSQVRRAAVMTTAHWVRQLSFWGAAYDPSAGDLSDGRYAIPGMALSLLRPWMRVAV